jgi:DNA repair exonuclease SbcCD ATPase subunit
MALQLGALRDALIDAGAKPEIAGKAAEELAAYDDQFEALERVISERFAEADRRAGARSAEVDQRFAGLDTRLARLEERMDGRFGQLDERFQRVYWMLGVVIVLLAGVLGRLLFIHG